MTNVKSCIDCDVCDYDNVKSCIDRDVCDYCYDVGAVGALRRLLLVEIGPKCSIEDQARIAEVINEWCPFDEESEHDSGE